MKRPAASENTLERIKKWRAICPDLTIRSTFIVGFPGETESDFNELLEFLDEAQLDRVGCFKYSAVEGATANELADHVDESVKEERWSRFMERQQAISAARLKRKVGSRQTVIIDGIDEERDCLIARSKADAPEIDGVVYVEADGDFSAGDFIEVEITSADEYDLYGKIITADQTQ